MNLDHILIFKTNIQTKADKKRVQLLLNADNRIQKWNIDQDDVDCVLRIVSGTVTPQQIIATITQHGFDCSELE